MGKKRNSFDERRFRAAIKGDMCLYCGLVATTEDHFPPVSHSLRGYLLPACAECNGLAGTNHPTNLKKRIAYVKEKLELKYKKLLAMPVWSKDELKQIGYNLRSGIKECQNNRRIA
jgi:hypothetical protein